MSAFKNIPPIISRPDEVLTEEYGGLYQCQNPPLPFAEPDANELSSPSTIDKSQIIRAIIQLLPKPYQGDDLMNIEQKLPFIVKSSVWGLKFNSRKDKGDGEDNSFASGSAKGRGGF